MGRRRKKKQRGSASPAGQGEPSRTLGTFFAENWKELSTAGAILAGLALGLGRLAHQSRLALLGLDAPIRYPESDLLLTSFDVVVSWFRFGLAALFSGHGVLLAGAWVPFLLVVALRGSSRFPLPWRKRGTLAVAIALLLVLVLSWILYASALYPPHTPSAKGPDFEPVLDSSWQGRATFEAVNWLLNPSPLNAARRAALGGLVALFVLASVLGGATLWRRGDLKLRLRRVALGLSLLLAVAFAALVPRAYVFASWGLRYHPVQVKAGKECDEELASALASGRCCAFDVAEGGEPRYLLLRGEGCPTQRGPFVVLDSKKPECIALGPRRGVFDGCG